MTTVITGEGIAHAAALSVRAQLKLRKVGLKGASTLEYLLAAASSYTGSKYKRSQIDRAIEDITIKFESYLAEGNTKH